MSCQLSEGGRVATRQLTALGIGKDPTTVAASLLPVAPAAPPELPAFPPASAPEPLAPEPPPTEAPLPPPVLGATSCPPPPPADVDDPANPFSPPAPVSAPGLVASSPEHPRAVNENKAIHPRCTKRVMRVSSELAFFDGPSIRDRTARSRRGEPHSRNPSTRRRRRLEPNHTRGTDPSTASSRWEQQLCRP